MVSSPGFPGYSRTSTSSRGARYVWPERISSFSLAVFAASKGIAMSDRSGPQPLGVGGGLTYRQQRRAVPARLIFLPFQTNRMRRQIPPRLAAWSSGTQVDMHDAPKPQFRTITLRVLTQCKACYADCGVAAGPLRPRPLAVDSTNHRHFSGHPGNTEAPSWLT